MVLVKVCLKCMVKVYNNGYNYVTWVSTNNLFVSIIIILKVGIHVSCFNDH